jgi:hypothetical protein
MSIPEAAVAASVLAIFMSVSPTFVDNSQPAAAGLRSCDAFCGRLTTPRSVSRCGVARTTKMHIRCKSPENARVLAGIPMYSRPS